MTSCSARISNAAAKLNLDLIFILTITWLNYVSLQTVGSKSKDYDSCWELLRVKWMWAKRSVQMYDLWMLIIVCGKMGSTKNRYKITLGDLLYKLTPPLTHKDYGLEFCICMVQILPVFFVGWILLLLMSDWNIDIYTPPKNNFVEMWFFPAITVLGGNLISLFKSSISSLVGSSLQHTRSRLVAVSVCLEILPCKKVSEHISFILLVWNIKMISGW